MRRLIVLGLLSEAIYVAAFARPLSSFGRFPGPVTDLLGVMGQTPRTFVWYVGSFLTLFALYGLAYVFSRKMSSREAGIVIAFGALFALTLIAAYPVGSKDFFGYILEARLFWTHDINPLVMPRGSVWSDPFRAYSDWSHLTSSYGPAWILLTGIPLVLGNGVRLALVDRDFITTFFAFKSLILALYLGTTLAVYLTVRRVRPSVATSGALLFAWNPLVLYEAAVNGHNDLAMLFFGVLAIYCAVSRRWWIAFPALAISVLTKYTGALLGPPIVLYALLVAWQSAWLERAKIAGAAVLGLAVAVALLAPFWEGVRTFSVFWGFTDYFIFSPYEVSVRVLQRAGIPAPTAVGWLKLAFFGIFMAAYAAAMVRVCVRPERLLQAAVFGVAAYLLIGAFWFHSWYVLWLVVLAALLPLTRYAALGILFAFTASMLDAVWLIAWRLRWYGDHIAVARGITVVWVFGPVFAFLLLWALWTTKPYIVATVRYWWQRNWWAPANHEWRALSPAYSGVAYADPQHDD